MVIPDRSKQCPPESHGLWGIDLPNGDYLVSVGYSDPSYDTATDGCKLEGQFAGAGVESASLSRGHNTVPRGQPMRHMQVVHLDDGRLTFDGEFESADGRHCQSISFMLIEKPFTPAKAALSIGDL